MERVRFQSLAVILRRNPPQGARAPVVDNHGKTHHAKGGQAGLDLHMAIEETQPRFVNDRHARQQQQTGFKEGREVLDFAMAILVVSIGGFVGNADREERNQRRDQIQPGMRGF